VSLVEENRNTYGEDGHVMMKAKTGEMNLKDKEGHGFLKNIRS